LGFTLITRQLDGVRFIGHINDAAAKDISQSFHFFSLFTHSTHFNQHQLALNMGAFA
jgi:hypothetical protein